MRLDRPSFAALLAVTLAALGGCGSGSPNSGPRSTVLTTSAGLAGARSDPTAPTAPAAEQSKPPAQILADAAAALGRLHSFHVDGAGRDTSGPVRQTADIVLPGRLRIKSNQYGKTLQIVVIGADAYVKVNAPARSSQTPNRVDRLLAGRWVRYPVPTTPDGLVSGLVSRTNPRTVGRCMLEPHLGTLRRAGTTTVDGQPAVIVADKGDVPGSTPKEIYIATTGPPLPLLVVQTGRQVPGGVPNKGCGETLANLNGSSTRARLSINGFNHTVSITAPPGAVRGP